MIMGLGWIRWPQRVSRSSISRRTMSVNASTTVKAPLETVLKTFVDEAFVRHVSDRAGTQLE